ncbi:MAG: hypothetical protein QME51_07255, partial [Planctomycetota bacterium]|nr:hypothetical protein [Planctomycetota bacterium]
ILSYPDTFCYTSCHILAYLMWIKAADYLPVSPVRASGFVESSRPKGASLALPLASPPLRRSG